MKTADMTRVRDCDPQELELDVAAEEFLIMAQNELQRLLNDRGLRYRDLARLLKVTEARVSKMFRDDAANLTLRSVAKIFHTLGETAVVTSQSEIDRKLDEARGARATGAGGWIAEGFPTSFAEFGTGVEFVDGTGGALEQAVPGHIAQRWISADRAASAIALAAGGRG